jgi:hypothetical protein
MDERDTTQIRGYRKTGDVADNAAANRDHQRLAIRTGTAQGASNLLHAAKMFRGFCVAEKMHAISIRKAQPALHAFANGTPNLE